MTITKSGELASFYTVNKAPIKHLRVYFSPKQAGEGDPSPENVRKISGWDGIEATQCGVNIFDRNNFIQKSYYFAPTTISSDARSKTAIIPCAPNTTYTIYKPPTKNDRFAVGCSDHICEVGETLTKGAQDLANIPNVGWTSVNHKIVFTTDSTAKYLYIRYRSGFTSSDSGYATNTEMLEHILGGMQVEVGENEKSYDEYEYKPYVGSTQTVDWSNIGTIYGGYVDLITGEVQEEWSKIEINSDIFIGKNIMPNSDMYSFNIYGLYGGQYNSGQAQPSILSTNYDVKPAVELMAQNFPSNKVSLSNNGNRLCFFITANKYANEEEFIASMLNETVIMKLATLNTYHLTPTELQTFIGQNHIWSNADRVEVEYDLAESNDILYRRRNVLEKQYPHIITPAASGLINFDTDMKAPLKQCKVYFNPIQEGEGDPSPENVRNISGWTSLKFTQQQTPINIKISGEQSQTNNNITCSYLDNNTFKIQNNDGNNVQTFNFSLSEQIILEKDQLYYIHFIIDPSSTFTDLNVQLRTSANTSAYSASISYNGNQLYTGSHTFNGTQIASTLRINLNKGSKDIIFKYIITKEPIQYTTIDWTSNGTIYGGYVDLVTGEVVAEESVLTIDAETPLQSCAMSHNVLRPVYALPYTGADANAISSNIFGLRDRTTASWNYPTKGTLSLDPYNDLTIRVAIGAPEGITTQEEWIAWLEEHGPVQVLYQLATPTLITTLTPTQLKTLRGTNNIWSNANGNIELSYWKH